MDAKQFDLWTRWLGKYRSRRAVVAGLMALAMAPATPALATQPASPVPSVDEDDLPDSQDDGDEGRIGGAQGVCADFVWCKASQMNMRDGTVTTLPVGRIPGGPYETEWCWDCYHLTSDTSIPGCVPIGHAVSELAALCNSAYPDMCQEDCCAGALFDVFC